MAPKILVVDDDPGVLSVARRFLGRDGLDTDGAGSKQDAILALAQANYDVAVVDLYLPGPDGFEILQWLTENSPSTVTLVLSGTTRVDDVIRAMEAGAFDFCTKPVEGKMFVNKVRRSLWHKELRDRNEQLMKEIQTKNVELENRLAQLELAHRMLQAQTEAMQADLRHAWGIQHSFLPRTLPFHDKISLAALYYPANRVGGDFFDVFRLDDRHLGFYIADTAGHGVSSALVTVFLKLSVQSLLWQEAGSITPPGHMLRGLNRLLFEEPLGHDLFISMAYVVLDTETLEFGFASAGHPAVQLRRNEGKLEAIRHSAPALGVNPEVKYAESRHTLNPGEVMVFHTDGVTDVQNDAGEYFGISRLVGIIAESQGGGEPLVKAIDRALREFGGPVDYPDDCTVAILGGMPQSGPVIPLCAQVLSPEECSATAGNAVASATDGGCMYIQVFGTGTWKESQQVVDLVQQARRSEVPLVIMDFGACRHLDSTFMGVLHTLCSQADMTPLFQIHLQNVPRALLKLMSELGLTSVLLCFRAKSRPLPNSMCQSPGEHLSREEMSRVLLSAHEALVKADPRNADRFATVLSVLHQEVSGERAAKAGASGG